jgi:hypothetical protein
MYGFVNSGFDGLKLMHCFITKQSWQLPAG